MKTLLIIGGTGFFGKSILDAYRRGLLAPWNVSSIKLLARHASSLRSTAPDLLSANIQLIDSDISRCDSLPSADFVIHAAASADTARYLSKPDEERTNILMATSNYCRLASKFHRKSKIIYISSGAVYGQQSPLVCSLDEEDDVGSIEKMDLGKQDYAAAKRDSEKAILELGIAGCNVSIARCFAFVGAYLPQDQHFAIGNFLRDGILGRGIEVKSDKQVLRSYMYADDLVLWLMSIMDVSERDCPIFNVGSDQIIEIGELARIIASMFNVGVYYSCTRTTEEDRYIPSINKALSYGLKLNYSLSEAIEETVERIRECKFD